MAMNKENEKNETLVKFTLLGPVIAEITMVIGFFVAIYVMYLQFPF